MSQEKILEIRTMINDLERTMRPLEWDLKQNQINEYRKVKLKSLKEKHKSLSEELIDLQKEE